MGLFGSIGKALGGVGKALGSVTKFAVGSGILPIPFGGTAGKLVGALLQHKQPMATSPLKYSLPPITVRGKATGVVPIAPRTMPTATILRSSPVLPGGAVAHPSGPLPRAASPPSSYAGTRSSSPTKRRKRRTTAKTKRRSGAKKKRTTRRLKFGSPAWRKKYMKKRR